MSDSLAIAAVVILALLLLSVMLVTRLSAGGLPARRINMLIGELWVVVGAAVALLMTMGKMLGPPGDVSGGLGVEMQDLGRRFTALGKSQVLFGAGAVVALYLFVHLLYSINRAMRSAPPP